MPYKTAGVKILDKQHGIKQFVIVTGMSGAGKTMTLKVLEDFGFITIDSLPPELLPQLFQLFSNRPSNDGGTGAEERGVAATIDVRNVANTGDFIKVINEIEAAMPRVRILFLTASDEELLRRFERTRRIHPLSKRLSTREGIAREREILTPIFDRADIVIDTSWMDLHQHRERLLLEFFDEAENGVSLLFSSFGFKYGVPQDGNFVLDVRCLPNPYYVPELRSLSGADKPVQDYLRTFPETEAFMERCRSFLDFTIPQYLNTVRGQLHVAVGCTGGRHRSVAVAEWLYQIYSKDYRGVSVLHRDKGQGAS